MRNNDDHLYLSKFEVDPEHDIFIDSMDDPEFFHGNNEKLFLDENYFDDIEDDIWEA